MLTRIWTLATKELIQLWRDKMILLFVFFGPITELALVAWATSGDIEHLPTAVVDRDHSPASRALVQALENTGTFDADYYLPEEAQAQELIDMGTVLVAVFIPRGFEEALTSAREPAQLQVILDGADPSAARTAAGSAEQAIAAFGQGAALERLGPLASGWGEVIKLDLRVWFNEELKTSNYEVPSELGFMLVGVALMLASLGIARERELGTLEQLMVTPLRSTELIFGKALPVLFLSYLNFLLMLGLVVFAFRIPMRGSWSLLLIIAFFYLLIEMVWGLMISAVSRTQVQALLLAFMLMMVEVVFSGYAFPVENMPWLLQRIANFVPIKHWLLILRGILLKGAGVDIFWRELLSLAALGVGINVVTIFFLRRRLE
ncbi:MAG: ABC transporter permease [Anaerolineae bacterium]|nr:ABC transporter permease [Anaerolineae bacterium]